MLIPIKRVFVTSSRIFILVTIILIACRSIISPRMCFKKGDTIGMIQVDYYKNGVRTNTSCTYIISPDDFCADGSPSNNPMVCR